MKSRRSWLLIAAAVVAATTVSGPAGSSPDSDCLIEDYTATHDPGPQTPQGHYEFQSWIANETAQKAVQGIGSELRGRFGSEQEQEATGAWLARGWIGAALDHETRTYVVVVDPKLTDRPQLERRLQGAVRAAYGSGSAGFAVEVAAGCFSSHELGEARRVLHARNWHPAADEATYGLYLDAHDSTYHVTFRPEDADAAAALEERLGELVTVDYADIGDLGRLDDGEPHWGGAGIRAGSEGSNHCTSAFTIRLANGNKGSVTAAHCFSLTGSGTINGRNVYSGPQFYGETEGASNFPTYDMVRIAPKGETFDNKIHTDPCCPSVRTVVADGNPDLHEFVCVSGKSTRAKCGAEVRDLNATACTQSGCTPNLMYAKKPGEVIAQGGDSGGPVYNRFGDSNAAARGMIKAGLQSGGDFFYAHKIVAIKNHLNITVVTS